MVVALLDEESSDSSDSEAGDLIDLTSAVVPDQGFFPRLSGLRLFLFSGGGKSGKLGYPTSGGFWRGVESGALGVGFQYGYAFWQYLPSRFFFRL